MEIKFNEAVPRPCSSDGENKSRGQFPAARHLFAFSGAIDGCGQYVFILDVH